MSDNPATPDSQIVVMTPPQAQSPVVVERTNIGRLVRRTIFDLTEQELQRLKLMAQMYAASSFNGTGKYAQKEGDFFLIMLKGIELGIMPMAAVDSINIIAGKPVLDAKGMLALVKSSGLLEDIRIDSNPERCIITIKRVGNSEQIVGFSMEDARAYKTTEWVEGTKKEIPLSEKSNWKSQPEVMLTWRCTTKALRLVFSDIVLGLLTPEEMDTENTVVHSDGSMDYVPSQKTLPASTQPVASPTPAEEVKSKAWHEDIEQLKTVLGHCKNNGWIQGDTIGKLKESFHSLLKKPITDFETTQAAIDAADAEIKTMWQNKATENPEPAAEENKSAEAWHTLDGIAAIVNWAKGHGYGNSEPELLKLLNGKKWENFEDGRAACKAIEAAHKAKPAETPAKPKGKSGLSDIDLVAISSWVLGEFNLTLEELKAKVDLSKYSTITTAKTMIKQFAELEAWPVVCELATYNEAGKYIAFKTALGEIRHYSRSKFAEMVSPEYFAENGIEAMPDGEECEIEPIVLTWESKRSGDSAYKVVKTASPLAEAELA